MIPSHYLSLSKLLITTQDLFSVAFNNVEIPKSKFGLINLDTMYLEHYKLIDYEYLNHKNGEVVDILSNHEILWLKIGKKKNPIFSNY